MSEYDELGARLREAARDAAPPAYDAPTARRRAQTRQRRGVAAGVLGAAAAAVGVSVLVAAAQGGTSSTLPPATPPSVSSSVDVSPSGPGPGPTSAQPSEPAPSSPAAPPVAEPAPVPAEPTGDDPVEPSVPRDDQARASEPPVVEQPQQPAPRQTEQPPEPEQTEPPRPDPTTAPPARATTAPPRGGTVQLRGNDLGVTQVGAPRDEAVAALTAALGAPRTPSAVACISDEELAFGDFRLAISGGRVSGWSSRSTTLRTPSGFRVGTTVAQLRARLGDRLVLSEANPDNPEGFRVTGVEVYGDLSGSGDEATVTRLFNGACSGP